MTPKQLVRMALREDLPKGDITTDPLKLGKKPGRAKLVAKQALVLSGCEIFALVFKTVDAKCRVKWLVKNGASCASGTTICEITGPLASLLKAERTALNFMGHLSGVATLTSAFVEEAQGTKAKVTDTRKTLPGLRALEKRAVRDGGGTNHRSSLSDGILVKENHIRAAGGITAAVKLLRTKHKKKAIEVEVTDLTELQEALDNNVERVLLDNMNTATLQEAVRLTAGRALLEASGNMSKERIREVALTGVDFISVGKLTHSAPQADISLLFEEHP